MTMPSLPARGDKDWRDNWAQAVHDAAAEVTTGRLTDASLKTNLRPEFAPAKATLRGNRAVFLGDSITLAAETGTLAVNRAPALGVFSTLSAKGRLTYLKNAGVAGNTAAQMLARFDADVTPHAPSLVHILAGTNDSNDAAPVAPADYATSIRALVAKVRAIGAMPVLGSVPPNEVSAARKTRITAYNAWLRRYCQTEGILLVDYYGLLVDPVNGNFKATYYSDGTHPNNRGQSAMGALMAATVRPYLAPVDAPMPQDNTDPNNLLTGGLFLSSTQVGVGGAHLQPSGWTLNTSAYPAGMVADLVTGDTAIHGNWFRMTATDTTGKALIFQNIAGAKVIPGHRYAYVGRIKTTGLRGADSGAGTTIYTRILFNGTQNNGAYDIRAIANDFSYDIPDGVFYAEAVAPADATALQAQFTFGAATATAASGVVQFAQLGLYNLTAMGVV